MTEPWNWPVGQSLSSVSPTTAAELLACPLRVAFATGSTGGAGRAAAAPARLGRACHAVLETAARGGLPPDDDGAWRAAFDHVWARAIEQERLPGEEPQRWAGYARKKVFTRRLALSVCAEVAEGEAVAEAVLTSRDGALTGRPDLIMRQPIHEVRDFKTGGVEDAEGNVREPYVRQLELYAKLEHDTTGKLPETAAVVPLEGVVRRWVLSEDSVERHAALARIAHETYNERVATSRSQELARPSPEHCLWCRWAPRCPAFWVAYESAWWDDRTAVAGQVTERRVAARGTVALSVVASSGSYPVGSVTHVTGIEPPARPRLAQAEPGDDVWLVGLHPRGADRASVAPSTREWIAR